MKRLKYMQNPAKPWKFQTRYLYSKKYDTYYVSFIDEQEGTWKIKNMNKNRIIAQNKRPMTSKQNLRRRAKDALIRLGVQFEVNLGV